jgi:hypothetical protein
LKSGTIFLLQKLFNYVEGMFCITEARLGPVHGGTLRRSNALIGTLSSQVINVEDINQSVHASV